ncbi:MULTISPECIES: HAD-IA family hydrolase [unclassified Microbacterium]|uniref:HAD-IA family hydrolase n=1 Tax=unclassified Microbacterium TaxID=2609290 RepID=UPI0012FC7F7E|nr:HAD-IA family hydrolase [Microbacterium sp. MAH-37]MVQ42036.1 HAD-IA family hydrolase [Microbacterium sp. MAH-37]
MAEQRVNKPYPQAYLLAPERVGADAADVLFIDDRQHSIDGAAAVGIRGVLQRENASTIAAIEAFLGE